MQKPWFVRGESSIFMFVNRYKLENGPPQIWKNDVRNDIIFEIVSVPKHMQIVYIFGLQNWGSNGYHG